MCFILLEEQSYREGTQRKLAPVDFFPKQWPWLSWAKPKVRSFWVSHMGAWIKGLGPLSAALSGTLTEKWMRTGAARI